MWYNKELNIGEFKVGSTKCVVFKGDTSEIRKITVSCGCTTYTLDEGILKVCLKLKSFPKHLASEMSIPIRKNIVVYYNPGVRPHDVLYITGKLIR